MLSSFCQRFGTLPDTLKALTAVCGVELYKKVRSKKKKKERSEAGRWEAGRPEKQVQVRGGGGRTCGCKNQLSMEPNPNVVTVWIWERIKNNVQGFLLRCFRGWQWHP